MGIATVVIAAAMAILIEKRNIKNKWNKKENTVFFAFLFLASSLSAAWVLGVNLINPLKIIDAIYQPISAPITSYINQFK